MATLSAPEPAVPLAALRTAIAASFRPVTLESARSLWDCEPRDFLSMVRPDPDWWGRASMAYFGDAYRAIAGMFPDPLGSGEEATRTARDVAMVRQIAEQHFGTTRPRVLDLPCGYGRHLRALTAAGFNVIGMDLQEDFVRRAQADAPAVVADMRSLPVTSGAFDLVLNLWNSWGYFLDAAEEVLMLAECRRVLRTGGLLLVQGDLDTRPVAAGNWQDRMKRPLGDSGAVLLVRQVPTPARGGLICLSWVVIPGELPWQSPSFFLRIRDDEGWADTARVVGFSDLRIERTAPGVMPHEYLVLLRA